MPEQERDPYHVAIIGGGPAGIAPLLASHRCGTLNHLLSLGVAMVERSSRIGGGLLGEYGINSDSSGRTFADCLPGDGSESDLTRLMLHPATREIDRAGDGAVPLRSAGAFLNLVGDTLRRMVLDSRTCDVLTGTAAVSATRTPAGWRIALRDHARGTGREVSARNIVIATGAHQPADRIADELFDGFCLRRAFGEGRVLQSGDVLKAGGLEQVAARLAGKPDPRVVVVGGSTSAVAVAHALLHRSGLGFGENSVALLHRRPLRIYYPDAASAAAENYFEWTEDDICPVSGKVFRFAGFRLDSRELVMQARGLGGRPPEPRFVLHQIGTDGAAAQALVDRADLVVLALGYRPHGLPLFGADGARLPLFAQTGPQKPMVDGQCRVLDADGRPIPNAFGIGLAAGFVPTGPLGGEPSFRGQANGLWLWQHDVGALIVDALLAQAEPAMHPNGALPQPQPRIRATATAH